MKRRRFSEQQVFETLWCQGVYVYCHRCKLPIRPVMLGQPAQIYFPMQREHLHEIELGGPDIPANCRYSHVACHAEITNGTPATSAGSSKHRIAKAKRIIRTGKMVVRKSIDLMAALKPKPKRPFPKGRKMQSRGFEKRARQPVT